MRSISKASYLTMGVEGGEGGEGKGVWGVVRGASALQLQSLQYAAQVGEPLRIVDLPLFICGEVAAHHR